MLSSFKILISTLIALIFCSFIFLYFNSEINKDYVDGNVLHLPFITENPAKPSTLSPAWINNGLVYSLLFRPLILANANQDGYSPALAESFTISDDGLKYTFVKRKNLKWSDGTDLIADDVLFSIQTALNTKSFDASNAETFKKIKDIEVDELTENITIILQEPQPHLLQVLSQFLIFPKHLLEQDSNTINNSNFWENPVGSGMYRLAEKTDAYYKLEQNPYYIGQKPQIEEIYLHKDLDKSLDIYIASSVMDMVNYRAMRGYKEYKLPIHFYRYFAFNIEGKDGYKNPAMQDISTRNAIAMAIDNKKILETIYMNIGSLIGFDKHPYNLEQAQSALSNSSYNLNRPLKLGYYFNDTSSIYFVQAVEKNLEEVGFNVELIKEDSLESLLQKRNFDIMIKDLNVLHSTDWHLELHSSNQHARIYGKNNELDNIINELKNTLDKDIKAELIEELNAIGVQRLVRYPLINLNQAIYTSSRLILPKDYAFGNPWYLSDLQFEFWKIQKQ